MKLAIGFIAMMLAFPVHAKMCKTMTMDGKEAFMWAADDDGRLMATKYASGQVSTMDLCPEQPIEIVHKTEEVIFCTHNLHTPCPQ